MIDFTSPRAIWKDLQDAKSENSRMREALKRIANPSTVSGMRDQDRAPKLQKIADAALSLPRPERGGAK